jgi:hypothetical protein
MKPNLPKDPTHRSRLHILQYQHIDGTFELAYGGAALLMAACFYAGSRFAISGSFLSTNILPFLPLVAFVAGAYIFDALAKRFKRNITYQRTGFIEYQKPQPLKRSSRLVVWIGVPLLTIFVLLFVLLNRSKFQTEGSTYEFFLTPFIGLIFTGLWIIIAWKTALPRFYLTAIVSLLASAWALVNGIEQNSAMAVLLGAMGLALCFTGGTTLQRYLRMNPDQAGNENAE